MLQQYPVNSHQYCVSLQPVQYARKSQKNTEWSLYKKTDVFEVVCTLSMPYINGTLHGENCTKTNFKCTIPLHTRHTIIFHAASNVGDA